MHARIFGGLIILFSLIGVWASWQALLAHQGASTSELCVVGTSFDCEYVNQSSYAEVFGLPVAGYGMSAYALFFWGAIFILFGINKEKSVDRFTTLCLFASIGLGVQLYFTYIEAFILKSWCLFCLISQACILIIAVCAWLWRAYTIKNKEIISA